MTRFAYFKGQIVPIEQATVSVMTHALHYGTGCFEGIRAYWNPEEKQLFVFRMPEHFERLRHSASMLYMDLPYTVPELCRITGDVLRCEKLEEDAYIRPLVYLSGTGMGVRMDGVESSFALYAMPFGRYIEKEEGANAMISAWRRNSDNAVPARAKVTGGYVNSGLAKTDALLNGYDEAIVLNDDGHVSEGSAENLFLVRNGKLITPAVTENILEGITRSTVIQIASEVLGLEVVERQVDRTELYVADEAFFCGTGVQICAIASIDHRPLGNGKMGPVTEKIRNLYFNVVRGREPRYRGWCTPVYDREEA